MKIPAATLWDTKIQGLCTIVTARDGDDVELWMCANFAQTSIDPPMVVIDPNRLYPIDATIRQERRFAVNIFSEQQREIIRQAARIRRRAVEKARILGLALHWDRHQIPYLRDCIGTVFCEAEQILDTGDHSLVIARVLEMREHPERKGELPMLYSQMGAEPSAIRWVTGKIRYFLAATGLKERLLKAMGRELPEGVDLARNTFEDGGETDDGIERVLSFGPKDTGRSIEPAPAPSAILRRRVGVCVVGSGSWAPIHWEMIRKTYPNVDLYLCGREADRLARVGKKFGARDVIVGLDRAVEDSRFEAMTIVLPHHLHEDAVSQALSAGKHVMVEKPIARTLAEADRMIDSARAAGRILMVAEDVHFRPSIREAHRAIQSGDIGEPLYLNAHAGGIVRFRGWRADPNLMGGGVLIDIGVHYVRALRLLMGEPDRIAASGSMQLDTKSAGEDSVQLQVASDLGWNGAILLNCAGPRGHAPDIVISGDRGVIHLWPGTDYYDLYPSAPTPMMELLSYVRPYSLAEKLMRPELQRVRRRVIDEDRFGYLNEMREFVSAIADDREPATRAEDGRRDLEIVLCGYEALRHRAWIRISKTARKQNAMSVPVNSVGSD